MAARYAESAVVVGAGLIGCEAAACLAGRGIATTLIAAEQVPVQRRFGVNVGERVAKILSDNSVRFVGSATVTKVEDTAVHIDAGALIDAELVVSATGVRPDPRLAAKAGIDTRGDRIVVNEHMHTSALNVYAAGDVALAYNVTAGRRIPAEHWRDAAQQGLVAGLSRQATKPPGTKYPNSPAPSAESTLKYRGWGARYEHSRLLDHRNGFTVRYEAGGEVVGILTLNADEDYRRADRILRKHTPMAS